MKNLKKVLALVLAFACAFTMFAGAAFTDQADINADNAEAVDLLTTLKIIKGYEDGSFDPEGTVDRAEMAKMIYTIRNGGNDDASAHVGNTTSFTDISGHWAEGYIKYLQNTGIVAGKSATQFAPDAQVTTAEAMKMALALAGYDEKNAGLTGIDWQKNTLTYATTIGLTDNVASAMNAGCTRQDAAQILANALGATAVRYSAVVENFVNDSKSGLSFGGDPISVGYKWMDLWTSVGTLTIIDGKELAIAPTKSDLTDSDKDDDGNVVTEFINVNTDYSDLLGQKVKVLFNDGKNNSVIGVYAVPANDIVTVYKNEIEADDARIKIDGTLYRLEDEGVRTIIDGDEQATNWHSVNFVDGNSPDVVTLVDTDENGKIDTAVIKTVDVVKVSFVSSTQIIAGGETYRFSDENIAEDVAKDDWVMITENLYDDCKDIEIVEMATGTVNATKGSNTPYTDYQINDNWFITAKNTSDISAAVKAGVDVEYITVNNILFYVKRVTGSGSLDDILFVSLVGQDGLTNDQARVMFPNGDTATINLSDNRYDSNLDGDIDSKDARIVAGQFYEFTRTGSEYELSAVHEYAAGFDTTVVNEDYEDYYGEYTYHGDGDKLVDSDGNVIDKDHAPDAVDSIAKIADSADVIVYLPMKDAQPKNDTTSVDITTTADGSFDATAAATIQGFEIKHITGKQLKSNAGKLNGSNLDVNVLGVFTSDVDSLNRSTVVAVRFSGTYGAWNTATSGLRSDAHYGMIAGNVKNIGNGQISFDIATDMYDEVIPVIADKSRTTGYNKGVIVGFSDIVTDENNNYVIEDVQIVDPSDVSYGSITAFNSSTIEVNGNTELDRGDFSTEVIFSVENGDITVVPNGTPNSLSDGRTNVLYLKDSFAFIAVNEIPGQEYAKFTVDYDDLEKADGSFNYDLIRSLEWKNASTGETWDGDLEELVKIYDDARMDLKVTSAAAGTLTLRVNGKDIQTLTFTAAGQEKSFSTFTVSGNVELVWNGGGTSGSRDNITVKTDGSIDEQDVVTRLDSGVLTIGIPIPAGARGADATITVTVGGLDEVVGTGTNVGSYVQYVVENVTISDNVDVVVNVSGYYATMDAAATEDQLQAALNQEDAYVVVDNAPTTAVDLRVPANATLQLANDVVLADGSKVTIAAGGTLETDKVADTGSSKTLIGSADARIVTDADTDVTITFNGAGKLANMSINGDATIPDGETWYAMFGQVAETATGFAMTVENGTLTVEGTLKLISGSNGSSLTVAATGEVNVAAGGTVEIARAASVTVEIGGTFTGTNDTSTVVVKSGTTTGTISGVSGIEDHNAANYTWDAAGETWTADI